MNIFNIVPYVLDSLSDGRILRRIFSLVIQILGCLVAFGMLLLIIKVLQEAFRLNAFAAFVGLVVSVILAGGGVALMQIFFYRAGSVRALPDSPFTVIPIVSIIFRVFGEALAFFIALLFVVCILLLIFGLLDSDTRFILSMASNFFGDRQIFVLLALALIPLIIITICYYIAEALSVAVDIAHNVHYLAGTGPQVVAAQADTAAAADTESHCPECGAVTAADDTFCMHCGYKLG